MPHGYCTECSARVTVEDGRCLLDHTVDPATISALPGRRRARRGILHAGNSLRRSAESPGGTTGLATAERLTTIVDRTRPAPRADLSVTPPGGTPNSRTVPPPPETADPRYDTLEHALVVWSDLDVVEIDTATAVMEPPVRTQPTETEVYEPPPSESVPADTPWLPTDPVLSEAPDHRPGQRWFLIAAVTVLLGLVLTIANLVGGSGDLEAVETSAAGLVDAISAVVESGPVDRPLAELDQAARRLFDDATGLAEGTPSRAAALDAAGRSLEIERTMGASDAYRASFEVVSPLPSLPTNATVAELSDISQRYIDWSSAMQTLLGEAPTTEAYLDFRAEAATADAALEAIGTTYLDALRNDDSQTATVARDQARTLISSLTAQLADAEADLQGWLEAESTTVAETLARIGRET